EGAMVDAVAVIIPGILMGIELDQGQSAVAGGMGLQERPGDKMVAAEREEMGAARQDRFGLRLNDAGKLGRTAIVEGTVAVIDHRHVGEEIESERVLRIAAEDRRRPAN